MSAAGLILFAHGARDPRWAAPFEAVARRVREARPDVSVRLAFLELMNPTLVEAAAELAAAGCARVEVVPLFLGGGGHVRKDLPALLATLQQRFPDTIFTLHRAAGEEDVVIAALAAAALQGLQ